MNKYIIFTLIFFAYLSCLIVPLQAQELPSVVLNGKVVEFTGNTLLQGDVLYIPVSDKGTVKIIDYFGVQLKLKTDEIYINNQGKPSRFRINENKALVLGEWTNTDYPPFIKDNITYISFSDLARSLYIKYKFDSKNNSYLIVPTIYSITFEENKEDSSLLLLLKATSKIRCNTYYLPDFTFAIEIPDCYADLSEEVSFNNYDFIEDIKISQKEEESPLVYIEIKFKRPVSAILASRIDLSLLPVKIDYSKSAVTELWLPEISEKLIKESENQRTQLIKKIDVISLQDKRLIKINTTGIVRYNWQLLGEGDNRFYIDFSRAFFNTKNIIPVEDDVISGIKLVQFSRNPDIVRVVFKLKQNTGLKVYPSEVNGNELIIAIGEGKEFAASGEGIFGNPFTDRPVVIDPGHGGGDGGAVNSYMGLMEKSINLDIALRLESLLTEAGFNVVLTRATDRDVTWEGSPDKLELQARADVANNLDAGIFISIHHDSSTNSGMNGTGTFYYKDIDYELAITVQKYLAANLGIANRGATKSKFYVLAHTSMPAVLVEVAFMSNSQNASLIATEEFRQKAAQAICDAVIEYFTACEP